MVQYFHNSLFILFPILILNTDRENSTTKRKKATSVANDEKERRKEERQHQRNILSQQNSNLLERMQMVSTDVESDDEETLVQDCMDILQAPKQVVSLTPLQPVHRRSPMASTPLLNLSPPVHSQHDVTPLLPRKQPAIQVSASPLPLDSYYTCTPTTSLQPAAEQQQLPASPRPQFGGKCPRRRQLELPGDSTDECASCKKLKKEIEQLKSQLAACQMPNGMFVIILLTF